MPRQHPNTTKRLRKRSRSLALLSAIANGSLKASTVLVAGSAPLPRGREIRRWQYDILQLDPKIDLESMIHNAKERGRTSRAMKDIQRRRLARLTKKQGRLVLEITEAGKRRLLNYQLDTLSIPKPEVWDGKWRLVLFDIPEKMRAGRDSLRDRLKSLGFLQLQRSAFVFPHSCEDHLDLLVQHYQIQPYVTFFTTKSLGYQEVKSLTYFDLKRPR